MQIKTSLNGKSLTVKTSAPVVQSAAKSPVALQSAILQMRQSEMSSMRDAAANLKIADQHSAKAQSLMQMAQAAAAQPHSRGKAPVLISNARSAQAQATRAAEKAAGSAVAAKNARDVLYNLQLAAEHAAAGRRADVVKAIQTANVMSSQQVVVDMDAMLSALRRDVGDVSGGTFASLSAVRAVPALSGLGALAGSDAGSVDGLRTGVKLSMMDVYRINDTIGFGGRDDQIDEWGIWGSANQKYLCVGKNKAGEKRACQIVKALRVIRAWVNITGSLPSADVVNYWGATQWGSVETLEKSIRENDSYRQRNERLPDVHYTGAFTSMANDFVSSKRDELEQDAKNKLNDTIKNQTGVDVGVGGNSGNFPVTEAEVTKAYIEAVGCTPFRSRVLAWIENNKTTKRSYKDLVDAIRQSPGDIGKAFCAKTEERVRWGSSQSSMTSTGGDSSMLLLAVPAIAAIAFFAFRK